MGESIVLIVASVAAALIGDWVMTRRLEPTEATPDQIADLEHAVAVHRADLRKEREYGYHALAADTARRLARAERALRRTSR